MRPLQYEKSPPRYINATEAILSAPHITSIAPMTKAISVYLLRHGEREDEVGAGLHSSASSSKERLDPALTEQGYRQANAALNNLLSSLDGKEVAVFSSPLRRTIGTALMIACAPSNKKVKMILPTPNDDVIQQGCIPVLVMNGLCDCAAAVERIGCANLAVSKGYIDNAAMRENDSSESSPFLRSLDGLVSVAKCSSECCGTGDSSMIQFWKENDYSSRSFSPMTPPISIRESIPVSRNLPELKQTFTPVSSKQSADCFLTTLNRAIRLTVAANCNACIVVTHREGIRYLVRQVCQYRNEGVKLSTPYCCIAKFTAAVSSEKIQWDFEHLSSYEKYGIH